MHSEMELSLLLNEKFYFENPVLDVNRLYLNSVKLMKCKEGFE